MSDLKDFFTELPALAQAGIIGLAIVAIITVAYVIIKRGTDKIMVLSFMGFCLIILCLFAYMGIGYAKENKEVKTANKNLQDTTKSLAYQNKNLKVDSVKKAIQLNTTQLQLAAASAQPLSNEELKTKVQNISTGLAALSEPHYKTAAYVPKTVTVLKQGYDSLLTVLKTDSSRSQSKRTIQSLQRLNQTSFKAIQ